MAVSSTSGWNQCIEVNFALLRDTASQDIVWRQSQCPQANTTRWPNAGLMLAQCRRPALGQRLVYAGMADGDILY